MQCPKDKKATLIDSTLAGNLFVKCCPECDGNWIPAESYQNWQSRQPKNQNQPNLLTSDPNFVQSPFDTKAALCPDCQHYLSRAKVFYKPSFFVERCMYCGGIWCDKGEWEVLQKLGVHTTIEQMFSPEWQVQMREQEYAAKEKQATIDKLGPELAEQVFKLAEILEKHPNGEFGVAYLMRRFDK
ncbi:MAG TPA: zf-TFIIB domain-containing protein [Leptolyngbyaceae cyanobacterium]